jgi:hypothetical protein
MAAWSPTLEGFRTMFRRPSLSLAEIIWRWSFGATACMLFGTALVAYLDTLPVSNRDLRMLRTGQPALVSQAFTHIFRGSALRVALVAVILCAALAVLWILTATLGRAATLDGLLLHIRNRASLLRTALEPEAPTSDSFPFGGTATQLRSLAGLHFLRVALGVAACAAGMGALVLAGMASTKTNPHPGLVFFLATTMLLAIWALWSSISWFLAAAPIFVIREGKDAFGALLETATFFRRRIGSVISVGSWFGITHLILLVTAGSVIMFPLAFTSIVPPLIVFSTVLFLTLAYFAIVDALYVGRLAGYIAILETPPPPPPPPPPIPSLTLEQQIIIHPELAAVDQTETILSDTLPVDSVKLLWPPSADAALSPLASMDRESPNNEPGTPPEADPQKSEN